MSEAFFNLNIIMMIVGLQIYLVFRSFPIFQRENFDLVFLTFLYNLIANPCQSAYVEDIILDFSYSDASLKQIFF